MECDFCDKEATHIEEYSPYKSELYPDELTDDDISNWCDDCYEECAADI